MLTEMILQEGCFSIAEFTEVVVSYIPAGEILWMPMLWINLFMSVRALL